MKKVVIFGASGFIGSQINKLLTESKFEVVSCVNNNSKKISKKFFKNIKKIDIKKKIKTKITDVDTVIHAATPNDIFSKDFQKGMDLSLNGTKHVLDFCLDNNIKNLIFFSTFQVYGTNLTGKIREKTKVKLNNFNSLNHYFAEELCRFYSKNYNLNSTIVRPSNVYGIPLLNSINRDTLVPLCFAKDLKKSNKIKLLSSGKQNRNFVSNFTIAKICMRLINKFPKGYNILNISSNLNLSMYSIAKDMIKIANSRNGKNNYVLAVESDYPKIENYFKTSKSKLIKDLIPSKLEEKKNFLKVLELIIE
tara:strand:- start:3486 stop:4406 length:921 start_codon:yes stop_codon:yes gene_type:complete